MDYKGYYLQEVPSCWPGLINKWLAHLWRTIWRIIASHPGGRWHIFMWLQQYFVQHDQTSCANIEKELWELRQEYLGTTTAVTINLNSTEWAHIFKLAKQICRGNKLKQLHYKFLHRIIVTKKGLCCFGIKPYVVPTYADDIQLYFGVQSWMITYWIKLNYMYSKTEFFNLAKVWLRSYWLVMLALLLLLLLLQEFLDPSLIQPQINTRLSV